MVTGPSFARDTEMACRHGDAEGADSGDELLI